MHTKLTNMTVAMVMTDWGNSTFIPASKTIAKKTEKLDAALGVILMRSGYAAIERLGVENMMDFQVRTACVHLWNEFVYYVYASVLVLLCELTTYRASRFFAVVQVRFWKYRQQEWEQYASPRGVIQAQGDLSNAAYFDFISFAQMAAADACLREKKRQNPGGLLDAHFRATGDNILKSLREEAAGADVASRNSIPPLTTPPHEGAQEILALLAARGFATDTKVVRSASAAAGGGNETNFVSTVCGGATNWGISELLRRGCVCSTAYERVIIAAWLREALAANTTQSGIERTWTSTSFIEVGDPMQGGGCLKTVWTPLDSVL